MKLILVPSLGPGTYQIIRMHPYYYQILSRKYVQKFKSISIGSFLIIKGKKDGPVVLYRENLFSGLIGQNCQNAD